MYNNNTFKGVVKLTQAQFKELSTKGTITVDGHTLTYSPLDTLYVTNDGIISWEDIADIPSLVNTVNERSGDVTLTKEDVGLGNVDNVQQYSASNPPPYPVTSVNNQTGAVTLDKGDVGLGNVDNVRQYSASNPPPYPVTGVKGNSETGYRGGNVNITKANIGLGNVDNTADINKPVSTAQATAIADAKKAGTDAQSDIDAHTANKSNPHAVTKAQIGLENVTNDAQVKRWEAEETYYSFKTSDFDTPMPSFFAAEPSNADAEFTLDDIIGRRLYTFLEAYEGLQVAISSSERDDINSPGIDLALQLALKTAGTTLGGVKSGGDVTITDGIISVNDNSHNHTIANVSNLQTTLDSKADKTYVDNEIASAIGNINSVLDAINGEVI